MRRPLVVFAAAVLLPAAASAGEMRASADIKGCTDARIAGSATLV